MNRRLADAAITACTLALLLAWDSLDLDLWLVRAGSSGHRFPWRDHWLASTVLHDGGRALATLVLAGLVLHALRPLAGRQTAAERWRWLAVTLGGLALLPLVKHASLTSCPWDLAEFGGAAQYVSHWRWGVADGGGGHCFPSGHAGAGYAFVGGWFALRGHHRPAARAWLLAALAAGTLFGLSQVLRGAHYPSHVLWSAWLCWTLAWGAEELARVPRLA